MPAWLHVLVARVSALVTSRKLDATLTEELEAHRALLEDEFVRQGQERAEARRRAALALGNPATIVQEHRERRWWAPVNEAAGDIRYALRQMRRRPGFTLAAALTMALGTGMNTAVLSALNAVAFRPLPIDRADRAVRIERWFDSQRRGTSQFLYSEPEYRFLRERLDTLNDLVAVSMPIQVNEQTVSELAAAGTTRQPPFVAELVSENFFAELGVRARLGQIPAVEDLRTPGQPVIFLSDAGWRARFNADPLVIGRTIALNGTAVTVVGVADPTFIGVGNPPVPPDFWAPLGLKVALASGSEWVGAAGIRGLRLVGHVGSPAAMGAARSQAAAMAKVLTREFPADDATASLTLERLTFFGETNDPRFALFIGVIALVVGVILFAACANLANMLLAAGMGRTREIALRRSLGAGAGRILRQLLAESVVLAWLGAIVALVASLWSTRLLWLAVAGAVRTVTGGRGDFVVDLSPDWRVFLFTIVIATVAGILFGIAPARQLLRTDLVASLKDGGATIQGARRSRLRSVLVAAQVAVSMTLAIVAGLLARGASHAGDVGPSFDTTHTYYVGYASDPSPDRALRDKQTIVRELSTNPSVEQVALVQNLPFTGTWTRPVFADQPAESRTTTISLLNVVSPTYFDIIGVRTLRGRTFESKDASAPLAVVSAGAARALWADQDPVGRILHFATGPRRDSPLQSFTVIGVVDDARTANVSRVDPAVIYRPISDREEGTIMVRSMRDPRALRAAVSSAVASANQSLVRTLEIDDLESRFVAPQRVLPSTISAIAFVLALLALALAVAGVHGVVAFLASQRVSEVALRLALGATRRDVVWLVLRQGTAPAVVGMSMGLTCALGISAALRGMLAISASTPDYLFGVGAFDPLTFVGVTAMVAAATFMAAAGPAWKTARIDPIVTLKQGER